MQLFLALVLMSPILALAEDITFIGSPISVELSEHGCAHYNESDDGTICLDRAFILKYKVEQVIDGESLGDVVEFIGFYHGWGMPMYTTYEPAHIRLGLRDAALVLKKIEQVELHDGAWWSCLEISDNGKCLTEKRIVEVVAQ